MSKNNKQFVEEYVVPARFDEDGVQASSAIGRDGKEYPDPVPMSPPAGYSDPPDILTLIRRMVRSEELRRVADSQGFDSFEEAEDFEVDDDPMPELTDYERVFEPQPVPVPAEVKPPSPVEKPSGVDSKAEGAVASPPPVKEEGKHSTST